MHNSHYRELTERVARQKNKLIRFNFEVVYQPINTTPSDYGLRHPVQAKIYFSLEREQQGVEKEEEDPEFMVAQKEELSEAVTEDLLQKHSKDEFQKLSEDIKVGRLRKETDTQHLRLKRQFKELSMKEGVILRGERILILEKLRGVCWLQDTQVEKS